MPPFGLRPPAKPAVAAPRIVRDAPPEEPRDVELPAAEPPAGEVARGEQKAEPEPPPPVVASPAGRRHLGRAAVFHLRECRRLFPLFMPHSDHFSPRFIELYTVYAAPDDWNAGTERRTS